jgi:hypothetical protein
MTITSMAKTKVASLAANKPYSKKNSVMLFSCLCEWFSAPGLRADEMSLRNGDNIQEYGDVWRNFQNREE